MPAKAGHDDGSGTRMAPPRPGSAGETVLNLDDVESAAPVGSGELPPRYRDLGRIASGSFGEVRRVEDLHLRCVLAMKILKPEVVDTDLRRRFIEEARLTAWLSHPGIVAVQDLGELGDGRAWYTMEEVRGETLRHVIRHLHQERDGWTLRRVVDVLMRASQAVASAHKVGVIHRDLKPDNVMVGAFGEVRVMDWGLGRRHGEAWVASADPLSGAGHQTQVGTVMGTPAYMPPEQARGDIDRMGPTADVYALGAMLYAILAGGSPYTGGARAAWMAVMAGPPPDLRSVAPTRVPDELYAICMRAMAREPFDRYNDAGELAEALNAWLEGSKRHAEAEAMVIAARNRLPDVSRLRAAAERLEEAGLAALADLAPNAPVVDKLPGWRQQDAARALRADAVRVEAEVIRDLRAALTGAPDLDSAHDTLADLYRARLEEAELRGNLESAVELELSLRAHDRGRHAGWLIGDGAVTLVTDPPGATVEVYRYEEHDRRLVEVPAGTLGVTPLVEARLPRGSYVLRVVAPGCVPVRYPVQIGRLEHWSGVRPGEREPTPIWLPPVGSLGPDDCYVPAGWFWSGGDPQAIDALPRRRLWVDGLLVRRHPVTNAELLVFLDDLVRAGRRAEAEALCPRSQEGAPFFVVGPDGRFGWGERRGGAQDPSRLDEPATFVTAATADAFAAWEAARTGRPWRLPHDQEWEKAARGVDGRAYPWGERLDPSWACMQLSHVGVPARAPIDAFPDDVSPYGVRGLGGNVRDWCANDYRRNGLPANTEIVPQDLAGPDAAYRMVRGGSLISTAELCRAAGRMVFKPSICGASVGLRLVAGVTPG